MGELYSFLYFTSHNDTSAVVSGTTGTIRVQSGKVAETGAFRLYNLGLLNDNIYCGGMASRYESCEYIA
jgi:hypothetical protein